MLKTFWRRLAAAGAALPLAALLIAGCKSPPPGGEGSLAWTEISGHTEEEIRAAVVEVLGAEGYARKAGNTELTFEKRGSFGANLAFGDFDKGVDTRLQVDITTKVNGSHLLHCRAWIVRNAGDKALEDTQRITALQRGSFRELLEKVKSKVEGAPQQ